MKRLLAALVLIPALCGALFMHGSSQGTGGGGGSTLTSFTLVNTTGSTVNTIVSPFMGLQFKKGDIASGQWPKFVRDDTSAACVYSYGLIRTWSDGSLKHMTVVVRCPSTIAGSGTLKVDVQTGGSQPTTSSRTLAEVCGGNCSSPSTNLQMLASGNGINTVSGTNNYISGYADTVANGTCNAWIDGDAGKGWICDGYYKKSGTAQGQLLGRWYTFNITDGSGAFGGVRFMTRSWQPIYDARSPQDLASLDFTALTTCSGTTSTSCSGGTSTAVPFPYSAVSFTWDNTDSCWTGGTSGSCYTATGNTFFSGAADYNTIPVVLTNSGGHLPAGLSTGRLYYATASNPNQGHAASSINIMNYNSGIGPVVATNQCVGTCTMTPLYVVQPFGNVFNATAGTSGQTTSGGQAGYNFAQQGGSLSADATLRFTRDTTYWHTTRVLPPWSTSGASPSFSFNWSPNTFGPITADFESAGSRVDIGPTTGWNVAHFFNQTVNDESINRIVGMDAANLNVSLRQCGGTQGACPALKPINAGNPNNTYTGYTATSYWNVYRYDPYDNAVTLPASAATPSNGALANGQNGTNPSHIPQFYYYIYLWSGEPQFLDMLEDLANTWTAYYAPDNIHRNPALPTQQYALTTGFDRQVRTNAWLLRDTTLAAAIVPDTSPDGVDYKSYLSDSVNSSIAYLNTVIANSGSTYFVNNGVATLWSFSASPVIQSPGQGGFMSSYLLAAAEFGATVFESTDALTYMSNRALWWAHLISSFGANAPNMLAAENDITYSADDGGGQATTPITSDTLWGAVRNTPITWSSSVFTETLGGGGLAGFVPANGDKLIFCGSGSAVCPYDEVGVAPSGVTPYTAYYLCNVSGSSGTYTWKIGTSPPSGSTCNGPVTVSGTGTLDPQSQFTVPVNLNTFSFSTELGTDGYYSFLWNIGQWGQAICNGVVTTPCSTFNTNAAATVTFMGTVLSNGGQYSCSSTNNSSFCMQNSY